MDDVKKTTSLLAAMALSLSSLGVIWQAGASNFDWAATTSNFDWASSDAGNFDWASSTAGNFDWA